MFEQLLFFIYFILCLTIVYGTNDDAQSLNKNSTVINSNLTAVENWPSDHFTLGQVSAVSLDTNGNVVVFHRANHIWNMKSFSYNNVFANINDGPINLNTIITFNASSGKIIGEWGKNLFYMPHGLTIDAEGNVWTTDVAMHQVFKFNPQNHRNLLTLGTKFMPGNDLQHFCKPTSIAVMINGDFFVSDGYCNSRIIKYSADGAVIQHWGTNNFEGMVLKKSSHYTLAVPHALALAEDKEELCVADRESSRVVCYNYNNGTYIWQYQFARTDYRVFSVAYSPSQGGQLFIANGRVGNTNARGFVLNMHTTQITSQFGSVLKSPHDIAVSRDGSEVYVVELDPFMIHKFTSYHPTELQKIEKDPMTWTVYNLWIVILVATLSTVILIVCVSVMWYKISRRKKDDSGVTWKKPVVMDKVFRLDKLTDRQNSGHGFQRLKTDESDEETIATVNI